VIPSLRNWVRGILQVRRARRVERRGGKPTIGTPVVREDLRMIVQAGMSDELWVWLLDQGWREPRYRPDRRSYRDIPSSVATRLVDAAPDAWERVMRACEDQAVVRPGRGGGRSALGSASR